MKIFITWSGLRSRAVAEALKEYLPLIVNAFSPWLSSADIDKGANWAIELSTALATARAGIICLTPSNLLEPWILFEAGAIAKTVTEKPLACTLLIGLKSSDLTGPLALFQDTKLAEDDLLQLVKTLNNALGKDALKESQVEKAFRSFWPGLKERLDNLPADKHAGRPQRPEREMIEEILDTVRSTSQQDTQLLNLLAEGMTDLLEKMPNLALPHLQSPYMLQTVPNSLADILKPVENVAAPGILGGYMAGSDTSTSGNETPIMPGQADEPALEVRSPLTTQKR
jgi:hypothetical protein